MKNEIARRHERARRLMKNKGFDGLVLARAENIKYFTGVSEPSVCMCGVVTVPQRSEPLLAVMWLDKQAAQDQAGELTINTYTPDSQGRVIARTIKRLGIEKGMIGIDDRALTVLGSTMKQSLPHARFVNASNVVGELRWVKSEQEICLIQKACEIADDGMKVALESLRPGISELQVATLAEHHMMQLGSDPVKHRTMVASGSRASLIHPFATHKKIARGDIVAIDLGAVYHAYCSDIARTAVVGKASKHLTSGFDVLRDVQGVVMRKLRAGVFISEIETVAREKSQVAGYKLVGHVGHGVGLELEEHPRLRTTRTPYPELKVEQNMVVAFFQSSIQSKRCLGLRLEDTVVITESGARMLTGYPRELFQT